MKCPNCDFDSPPEMHFCGMCGYSLTRTCQNCSFINPINYQFCGMCGSTLLSINGSTSTNTITRAPTFPLPASKATGILTSQLPATSPETSPVALSLTGERRVASVIFADVKGSTELLEQIGTEAWVDLMNNIFQVLEAEIYRFNGEVGQFRGDGLVAFFGAKSASEDDPEHAVLCALAMQAALQPYAAELFKREGIQVSMRVGVNTGEVIVANVGDTQYSEATPMGEALTVASRMETSAEPGTVLVSDNTYRLVWNQFDWISLGEIPVKGLSQPIAVYRPVAPRKSYETEQETPAYGFTHGVIGRKNEQQLLKQSIDGLSDGKGGIVLVNGVKGMGKSFLINNLRQNVLRQNVLLATAQSKEASKKDSERDLTKPNKPIHWLHGRCRSYGHLRPYSMWLDLLQEWLETHVEEQGGEIQAILRTQIESQWNAEVEKDYPNLATFLSVPIEETVTERFKHMDAEGLKKQFFMTVRNWIKQLAQKNPLVISLADVQWADSSSLELLNYCLPLSDTEPVLWIIVYRSERDSPIWEFEHLVKTNYPHRLIQLSIQPLTKDESNEFLNEFLGNNVLIDETCELIIKRAEGNPYFIKELVFSLISQGVIVRNEEEGIWKQTKLIDSIDLPDSLQSVLMARIDRLSQGERKLLQMAAVIGSVFWINALQALSEKSISLHQLQNDLVELQRTGLIHERAIVEDLGMEYAFDSSLVREVAYESLLNSQRLSYHLQVAEYLEDIVFREGKRRYFNILAHHYRLAGDIKKELFYTLQAAERAQSIYANIEALHYYTRALDLLEQIEDQQTTNGHQKYAIRTQKFEALNGRRAVHFLMGNIKSGWEDARALLPLARQMEQDPTWLIDALLQQPGVYSADSREELSQGVPLAIEALNLAVKIGDKRREMNCLLTIASQRNLLNDNSWIEVGDRALSLAREIGDRQYEAMILLSFGHAYVGRDELTKGMEYLNAALPICKELDDRVAELTLLRVLGAQHERSGNHYTRLVDFELKRLQISREIGDRFEEANALMFCGQVQAINLGDYEGGLVLLKDSLKILEAVSGRIFPLLRIAHVQICLGHYEDAQQTLIDANPVAEQNVYDLGRVGLKLMTVILYNTLGDEVHLKLALEICEEIAQMESSQLISRQYSMAAACEATQAHLGLARLSANEKERIEHNKRAIDSAQLANEIYNSFGYINIVECSREEMLLRYSQALIANGFQEEANTQLEMAYSEMMRKYEFIPQDSYFRRTFLENIAYHREIRAAHTASTLANIAFQPGKNKK